MVAMAKNYTLNATSLFYRNKDATVQIVVNRGGAGSSKSFSIAQLFLTRFLSEANKKILILRKTLPSLRISTLLLFNQLIAFCELESKIRKEAMGMNYFYKTNMIHFGSVDDPEKIKSTSWNYIWMEETNEFSYEDFQMIKLRLREPTGKERNQLFMSFNPVGVHHWLREKVINNPTEDVFEIQSSYKDNPFLSEDYINTLENLINQDANLHRIYTLGEWGEVEHLIYTNWQLIDESPREGTKIYGLDFGYNNPTALVRETFADGKVYEDELLYKSGLTNRDLVGELQRLIPNKNDYIFADSAEPQRIEEILRAGFNVHPADKSVKDGIDYCKRIYILITKNSRNSIKESQAYSWKKTRDGKILDEPVEFMNHICDARRYALYSYYKKFGDGKPSFDMPVTFGKREFAQAANY